MSSNPLRILHRLGQSVWFDYIRRRELLSGYIKELVTNDGITGMTSNPSIFEKAISSGNDYDESIRKLVEAGEETASIFEALEVEDIQLAADIFRPIYDATEGRDGYVSIEVAPTLARDTQGSIAEARRLWRAVDRPNIMVKIPGTVEGLPAIEQALGEGININITLLFSIERYEKVAWAYVSALEKLAGEGKPIDRVASVASFFVSRIDVMVDRQLEAMAAEAKTEEDKKLLEGLIGESAIANAKLAYAQFKEIFASDRFQALARKGARVQRMLWASTSTKNPNYSDTLYIDTLIGPDTINTMPVASLDAYRDHGKPANRIEERLPEALSVMRQLISLEIDLPLVTQKLEEQGVELFAKDYEKLLAALAEKRIRYAPAPAVQPAAVSETLHDAAEVTLCQLDAEKYTHRLWARDPTLWKYDSTHQQIIRNSLGWLTVADTTVKEIDAIEAFAQEVKNVGFTHQVLLGMGGTSLCPDVCRSTFGTRAGFLQLQVLDSTVPASIAAVESAIDYARTLFLVSSKSGATTETTSFFQYFYDRVWSFRGGKAGENFVAITDPGTALYRLAKEKNFRAIFPGQPDIGGRYSALSNFGMVPAALAGVNIRGLLERAQHAAQMLEGGVSKDTPGVVLGAALAEGWKKGRDKVTFVISPGIRAFGNWAEQLLAGSTGKEGKGLIPIVGEELRDPAGYGQDRLFVQIKLLSEANEATEDALKVLEGAGHPVLRVVLHDILDLGTEFFRWEVATATVGALMAIDPFDQPNVQESKDNTRDLLAEYRTQRRLPEERPLMESGGIKIYGNPAGVSPVSSTVGEVLADFLSQARTGDYLAIMAFLPPTPELNVSLQSLRRNLRDACQLATTLGYGPRFLHSTGQLHKGGANNGLFIQITADDARDIPIPGEPYSFGVLTHAEALGDLRSLLGKQRRVIRVHLGQEVNVHLVKLKQFFQDAVKPLAQLTAR